MIDPSESSQWECAVAGLFVIMNDNIGCPKPKCVFFCIGGLSYDQCRGTDYYKLVEEAGDSGIDTVPFCREYNVLTLQIFLKGYLMLCNSLSQQDASCLFLEVVTFIHYNKPHTWLDEEIESYYRFFMYVLMIGYIHDDQIVLNWFRCDSVNLDLRRATCPMNIPILLKFLEIDEFHSYTTDSFGKLINFILRFSVTEQERQRVLQYVQKAFSSRRFDVAFADLSI